MVAAEIDKTQETFFSELPVGWRYDRLKDIVSLRNDKTSDKSSEQNYLELEDIEQGTGNLLSKKNTLDVESAVIRFKKGDVLFGKLRPYLEKYYYADFDGMCTGEILSFCPRGIKGHFLRYCVAAPWFIEKCNALAYGAKMPRVNWPKQLALFEIPIPSNSEQHRIAAYLDKTCTSIDKAIEFKQKQLEILDALGKSIVHKAVTRGLDDSVDLKDSGVEWIGRIPKHWGVEKLKRLLSQPLMYGTNEAAELDDIEYPRYIRITDFGDNGTLKPESFKSLPPDKAEGYYLEEGDLLFARSGATVGKSFLFNHYKGLACFAGYLIKARTNKIKLLPQYLYYFTKSPAYFTWKNVIFTQATIQNISATKYAYLPVSVPSIDEQQLIIQHLDKKMKSLDNMQSNLSTQISTLEQYRKSLIHECVTGKLRVNEDHAREQ